MPTPIEAPHHVRTSTAVRPQARSCLRRVSVGSCAYLVALLLSACATTREPVLSWSIRFECVQDGERTERVLLAISPKACSDALDPTYETTITRDAVGGASTPSDLAAGPYAFRAIALDARGNQVAEDCVDVDLPDSNPVQLVLPSSSQCAVVADGGTGGPGSGGGGDAGVGPELDGGLREATTGPRIDKTKAQFLSSAKLVVSFLDVTARGHPRLQLYALGGATSPLAEFAIPPPPKKATTSKGTHDFGVRPAGEYDARLVYDPEKVVDHLVVSVLSDRDGDGVADAEDDCPNDENKVDLGFCKCGTPETDSDHDGVPDCEDGCPGDAMKASPGMCGCGFLDSLADQDDDGVLNCYDACPVDATKSEPQLCGCGVSEVDSDGDGTPDCHDGCPMDGSKTDPGACGCGAFEGTCAATGCANVLEGGTAQLSCTAGQTITRIDFASYGTPTGSCGAFAVSACNATSSQAKVATACLGMNACNVPANNATFTDPCSGTPKRLAISYTCASSP